MALWTTPSRYDKKLRCDDLILVSTHFAGLLNICLPLARRFAVVGVVGVAGDAHAVRDAGSFVVGRGGSATQKQGRYCRHSLRCPLNGVAGRMC